MHKQCLQANAHLYKYLIMLHRRGNKNNSTQNMHPDNMRWVMIFKLKSLAKRLPCFIKFVCKCSFYEDTFQARLTYNKDLTLIQTSIVTCLQSHSSTETIPSYFSSKLNQNLCNMLPSFSSQVTSHNMRKLHFKKKPLNHIGLTRFGRHLQTTFSATVRWHFLERLLCWCRKADS